MICWSTFVEGSVEYDGCSNGVPAPGEIFICEDTTYLVKYRTWEMSSDDDLIDCNLHCEIINKK